MDLKSFKLTGIVWDLVHGALTSVSPPSLPVPPSDERGLSSEGGMLSPREAVGARPLLWKTAPVCNHSRRNYTWQNMNCSAIGLGQEPSRWKSDFLCPVWNLLCYGTACPAGESWGWNKSSDERKRAASMLVWVFKTNWAAILIQ